MMQSRWEFPYEDLSLVMYQVTLQYKLVLEVKFVIKVCLLFTAGRVWDRAPYS